MYYAPGSTVYCPATGERREAPRDTGDRRREDRTCNRLIMELGSAFGVEIRVHPSGKAGRPLADEFTTCCKRCGTMLEVRRAPGQAAA